MNSIKTPVILTLIFIAGIAIWTTMLVLTWEISNPNELLIDMGKTGAALALISVIGGLVQWSIKSRELANQKENEKLNFYRNILADLKSVYDRVESARLLIEAHRTAKTYGEQMRNLIDGVVILHNIKRALEPEFPELRKELHPYLENMIRFLKSLLIEYRDNYKRISILQEMDESVKKSLIDNRTRHSKFEISEEDMPSSAWNQIKDLKKLTILRDDDNFKKYESDFLVYLDKASSMIRKRIPIAKEK